MIRIGAWSTLLLVLALQLLVMALVLIAGKRGRSANRFMAIAMVATAGLLTPFIIGYAGGYDAWPWLSFAPFAVPLAVGPALFAYASALTGARISLAHWLPPIVQFSVQAVAFSLSLEAKTRFANAFYEPIVVPFFTVALIVSMTFYALACNRVATGYRRWLRQRRRDSGHASRLRVPVFTLSILMVSRAAYDLWDRFVSPVNYYDLFPYYVLIGMVGLWAGLDAWHGARREMPPIVDAEEPDWKRTGAEMIALLTNEGWWREPELDADQLARRLGTNVHHLSRAFNTAEGSIPSVLARIRAEAVAERLSANCDDDLLPIAFACGFGSKASFNRAFRQRYGLAPTQFRRSPRSQ